MYKRSMRLVFSAAVLSLAFLGLALAGCAGGPRAAGTAEIPSGFSTCYVKADGSDSNDGLSEAAPFKTLRKAVDAAVKGRIPVITVLGVLNPESEGESSLYPDSVFNITNTRGTELTIRGKEGADEADEAEQGVLSGAGAGKIVISVWEESRVRLEHLRIEGGSSERSGAGIQIRDQARLTLGEGTLIRNNHSRSGGGGVGVAERGTLIMEGGEISGNTAQGGGGGVVMNGGTFIMRSGIISGNESPRDGGGVGVVERGTFIMESGEISGNTAQGGGGGVLVAVNGTFTIEGGVISGNTAQAGGGGVGMIDGTFTMEGGEISGNTAQAGGGGVTLVGGSFTMRGGEISGNTAKGGGGVVVVGGIFTMEGGVISINMAQGGGGVAVARGSFTMRGGEISGNETTTGGGGVAINAATGGKFIKSGGTIDTANSAEIGNVVFVDDGLGYRKRDSAAGPGVNMDSGKYGSEGGWE